MPLLTRIREACWLAINHRPMLASMLRQQLRFDRHSPLLAPDPNLSLGDLPALAIFPQRLRTEWVLNQAQQLSVNLAFRLWTPYWTVADGEKLWEEITRALWTERPADDEPTFLENATDMGLMQMTPTIPSMEFLQPKTKAIPAIVWEWHVELSVRWDPRT